MQEFKIIDLKNLNSEQKEIIRYINNQIIEHQSMFNQQPEELIISKKDYDSLSDNIDYKYLLLGNKNIKIYKV